MLYLVVHIRFLKGRGELFAIKLIAAFAVLLAGVGGGAFAQRLSRAKSQVKISALANSFAGGVFLGAAFFGYSTRQPRLESLEVRG